MLHNKYMSFALGRNICRKVYEVVAEHSYKKSTIADSNCNFHSRQMRGESASSKHYSNMGKQTGKRKKNCVYHLRDQLKLTCLVHGPGYTTDECKALNGFGTKYAKGRDFKEHRQ